MFPIFLKSMAILENRNPATRDTVLPLNHGPAVAILLFPGIFSSRLEYRPHHPQNNDYGENYEQNFFEHVPALIILLLPVFFK
ncbi:MAG: hypothetical protein A3A43_00670 [Candidatus Liptonbacteria bacterium RIFCSPLOWO2_01_FULL_56_20]|uniref:Uncharacterized protein n=1 Tax=Candidatus Liptonbacteria bacterium RIFCSPLOWO2_01_FULL_56_20 TaxID=1798652 RepID=A0A1G2CH26_9BACT|nr:MAG: hypothetical protein A3A43_00670 [Candidatus Liptonbacteria bacterium RIFCSPLOWO2_01_FULL_56_20]